MELVVATAKAAEDIGASIFTLADHFFQVTSPTAGSRRLLLRRGCGV